MNQTSQICFKEYNYKYFFILVSFIPLFANISFTFLFAEWMLSYKVIFYFCWISFASTIFLCWQCNTNSASSGQPSICWECIMGICKKQAWDFSDFWLISDFFMSKYFRESCWISFKSYKKTVFVYGYRGVSDLLLGFQTFSESAESHAWRRYICQIPPCKLADCFWSLKF